MRLTKTSVAVEIAVLLGVMVAVVWLEHVLTNTRDMFVPAAVVAGGYLVVRTIIAARKRRAVDVRHPN